MSKVRGIKITIQQVLDTDPVSVSGRDWIVPKKATILSNNRGTLVEASEGGLYLVNVGDWFRSPFIGKPFPQVDEFNKLQDLGLTSIKDAIVRHPEKIEVKEQPKQPINQVKPNGQAIRSQNNVGVKKVNQAVAPNIKSEKKD